MGQVQAGWLDTPPSLPSPDGTPAHARVARWLSDLISRGELVEGDRLPREDEFAKQLGISRMTLRQALATLEQSGLLERKSGRLGGTFVREPRIECDLTGLAGFTELMRRAKLKAGARIISAATVSASAGVARELGLVRGAPVHEIVRVRTVRREPLAIERSAFPVELFPDLLEKPLTGSLYELLAKEYLQAPASAWESLEPVSARLDEAKLLKVELGSPLMLIERTVRSRAGQPVEFARDVFRPDRIRISLRTGVGGAHSEPALIALRGQERSGSDADHAIEERGA